MGEIFRSKDKESRLFFKVEQDRGPSDLLQWSESASFKAREKDLLGEEVSRPKQRGANEVEIHGGEKGEFEGDSIEKSQPTSVRKGGWGEAVPTTYVDEIDHEMQQQR